LIISLIRKEDVSLERRQKKRRRTTFERRLIVFIKIKQNIFLERDGSCYKNKN